VGVAIGLKPHSGWAALVALSVDGTRLQAIERCRIELTEECDREWARMPYHAAENLKPERARELIRRGIDAANAIAIREIKRVADRLGSAGHPPLVCAVLASEPMPAWSVEEILAVHFRMHKAEGVLFQDALAKAAERSGMKAIKTLEKRLDQEAAAAFGAAREHVAASIAALGKSIGAPWGKDQKNAALAAMLALGKADQN